MLFRSDVLHSAVAAVPLRAGVPTLATAHDLPWCHPEASEPSGRWRRFATVRALRAATAVLAPSAFTAADVCTVTGRPATDVHVVPHGVPLADATTSARDPATRRGPFLVLGDLRPRKNLARLQQAHALATTREPSLPPLRCLGPGQHYVDEAQKRAELADCRALVHASLFEEIGRAHV